MNTPEPKPANIVHLTDSLITAAVNSLTHGIKSFESITSAREVSKLTRVTHGDLKLIELLEALWRQIEDNWISSGYRPGGDDNWRWKLMPIIGPKNFSSEKKLEKELANVLPAAEWANQVPTSSGLSISGDRHRNIDLANWDGVSAVTIIELKVVRPKPDTPLHAAFEIVTNALLLRLARKHRTKIKMVQPDKWLRDDLKVHLRVLAPRKFYVGYALGWFEQELDRAVAAFGKAHALEMSFGFRFFDDDPTDEKSLLSALARKVEWT